MAISDKEQKALGKTVQVGLDQITNHTPIWLKTIFRVVSAICGVWGMVYIAKPHGLDMETANAINSWIVLGLPCMHYVIKLVGWDYKQD